MLLTVTLPLPPMLIVTACGALTVAPVGTPNERLPGETVTVGPLSSCISSPCNHTSPINATKRTFVFHPHCCLLEANPNVQIAYSAGPKKCARAVFEGPGTYALRRPQHIAAELSRLCPNVVKKKAVLAVLPSETRTRPDSRAPPAEDLSTVETQHLKGICRAAAIGTFAPKVLR